jgi:hypothetical protein
VPVKGGDWRQGFDAYRAKTVGSFKPLSPREQWFRGVFNFRQRFLWAHDPLCDAKTGELHLERAVEEARREFGGIDYLHLFDWGNCGPYGRIYGRTGDHSPYDYIKGGRDPQCSRTADQTLLVIGRFAIHDHLAQVVKNGSTTA